ncbi:DNA/RNA non-specific endonuclease, partial [Bacillus velezensis]|uniref:DNA/RNA non-specific endonuclease n=1 Tax=Bacillus velezensis TaxID=492670 RepID=UPI002FFF740D
MKLNNKSLALVAAISIILLGACNKSDIETAKQIVSDVATTINENKDTKPSLNSPINKELSNLKFDGEHQVITINSNQSTFTKSELSLKGGSWQSLSQLDQLNRVGIANAMLSKSMMPKDDRDPLYVKPTGWKNKKVTIDGKTEWLYNRCHLIGF